MYVLQFMYIYVLAIYSHHPDYDLFVEIYIYVLPSICMCEYIYELQFSYIYMRCNLYIYMSSNLFSST